jgi:TatD DNase family protein
MKTHGLLCDAHLHLQDPRLSGLQPSGKGGLREPPMLQVVNGTCEQDWDAVASLAGTAGILPAFGLHPWYLRSRSETWMPHLKSILDRLPDALIGEIGLDRSVRIADFELQKAVFQSQLALAKERNIPPTLHCLKAWGNLIEHLEALAPWSQGFLLHAFAGPAELVPKLIALGGYFSFSGYLTLPEKTERLRAWESIPNERIVIETDAPNGLPHASLILVHAHDQDDHPIHHPDNLSAIYEWAARWRNQDIATFTTQVWNNVMALFGEARVRNALARPTR